MPAEGGSLVLLLDEHYPGWLADDLCRSGMDAVALVRDRPDLRGVDDLAVLVTAVAEGRIVVTEDVTTFSAAVTLCPHHVGIIFCHHARFPRTRPGLHRLHAALVELAADPPTGLGTLPVQWWLSRP